AALNDERHVESGGGGALRQDEGGVAVDPTAALEAAQQQSLNRVAGLTSAFELFIAADFQPQLTVRCRRQRRQHVLDPRVPPGDDEPMPTRAERREQRAKRIEPGVTNAQ